MADGWAGDFPLLRRVRWYASDNLAPGLEDQWRPVPIDPTGIAFLQYTSGSTGSPKGVVVAHDSVLANVQGMCSVLGFGPEDHVVSWLPMFHDMGLFTQLITPVLCEYGCTFMSPVAFIQRPVRWLQAVSAFRGTTSFAPNFAFELAVRRSTEEERRSLDLSSWRVLANGAEPVRASVVESFARTFAPHGLREEALFSAYGLAEATLFITGSETGEVMRSRTFDIEGLRSGRAEPVDRDDPNASALVSCGAGLPGHRLLIVDPDTRREQPEGEVGEIWFQGPSVARGYWERAESTEELFRAHLAAGDGPFLRTGDHGVLVDGRLYVTGRLKDLVIIRGRNHFPDDIEAVVTDCHRAIRPGCVAAFSVDVADSEQLVVAAEVDPKYLGGMEIEGLVPIVRRAIREGFALRAHAVALIQPRTIAKTSSGKLQRHVVKRDFLGEELEAWVVHREETSADDGLALGESWGDLRAGVERGAQGSGGAGAPGASGTEGGIPLRERLRSSDRPLGLLVEHVRGLIARLLVLPAAEVAPDARLGDLGFDSLSVVELSGTLGAECGFEVDPTIVLDFATPTDLAAYLLKRLGIGQE